MDQAAIQAFDAATRQELFAELDIAPDQVDDLGGFESFVFKRNDKDAILRVTHNSHRDLGQVLAELDWIAFLAAQGSAVCQPIPQAGGELARAWRDFVVCEFPVAQGHAITEADWGPTLFREWGRCIGEFHRLTRDYHPAKSAPRRPDCEDDANFNLTALMPHDQPGVMARAEDCQARFMAQAKHEDNFGLIHSDAHVGNFHTRDGKLTFFDFDDACYCWFAYDIGTILLSAVLQQWLGDSQADREATARAFLPHFLEGYNGACEIAPTLLEQLPLCLKFREICLYGVISKFITPGERNWYTDKFMAGRRERIENDVPYLSLDFL